MDTDGFEAIVAAHHAEIRRYLLRITGRASDADDLSQETFLRAFGAYRALPAGANVRAWLFAIATNLGRNHFRSESRRRRAMHTFAEDGTGHGTPARPDAEALARQARRRVEALIDALPLKQRLAFIMRKMHDLEYPAIARSLECSEESARAHVFQALRKIRRALGEGLPARLEPVP